MRYETIGRLRRERNGGQGRQDGETGLHDLDRRWLHPIEFLKARRYLGVGWIRICVFSFTVVAGLVAETIHLKTRDFNPPDDPREYLAAPLLRRQWGRSHYLIQFTQGVDAKNLLAIRERGALVTGYLPNSTVMVAAGDDLTLDGLDVRWAGRLAASDKISPALKAVVNSTGRIVVVIEFHPDVSPDEARAMAWEQNLLVIEHPDLRSTPLDGFRIGLRYFDAGGMGRSGVRVSGIGGPDSGQARPSLRRRALRAWPGGPICASGGRLACTTRPAG